VLGRKVATLVNEKQKAGIYKVQFNASELSSGIYYYRLQAGDFIQTKKFILMK
jgi:5-hydroxyisourate hydrolase-like protein (transthyretin family)